MEAPQPSEPQFLIGDRVQLISSLDEVPLGTFGTVMTQLAGSSLYDVWFDEQIGVETVDGSKLALVQRERSQGQ
jgi:hypothetical protein